MPNKDRPTRDRPNRDRRDDRRRSRDDEYDEYDYDPRYDRQMRYAEKETGGGCCSLYKFILFILFLGGSLAAIFGFVDVEQIQDFFTQHLGGSGESGGTDSGGGGGSIPVVEDLPFMRCPETGECCNGLESNCDMRVDELLYATVHNANHDDILVPNHEAPLEKALEAGYRGLMLDVCKCDDQITFCHSVCGLGPRDATEVFTNINSFLDDNPTELVILNFEMSADDPTPQEIWNVISPITDFRRKVYNHDGGQWPTMRELLANNHQVLLFEHNSKLDCTNGGVGCAARIESFFQYAVENPWDFDSIASLENTDVSCAEDRGSGSRENFFSVNGFITGTFGPSKSAANTVNQRDFINNQIQKCEKVTKHKVNFYNIDFWQRGDLLSVTQEINIDRGERRRSRYLRWIMG